jgi:hypothetical protein
MRQRASHTSDRYPVAKETEAPNSAAHRPRVTSRLASIVGNRALGRLLRNVLATPGQALDRQTEGELAAGFGTSFRGVRVHADADAAAAADAMGATAFTVGQHVFFAAGRYSPQTLEGHELLAHELAHTVQQRGATSADPPVAPDSALEANAAQAARAVTAGAPVSTAVGRSGIAVARQVAPGADDERSDEEIRLELAVVAQTLQAFAIHAHVATSSAAAVLRQERDDPTFWDDYDRVASRFAVLRETLARRRALAQADKIGTQQDEPEPPEEELITPMALAEEGKPAPQPRPAPKPRPAPNIPPQFLPGGFTDDEIKRLTAEADERVAPPTDPRRFMDRWYAARRHTALGDDANPESVWAVGRQEGLFAEYERDEFDATWEEHIGAPNRAEAHRNTEHEQMQRQMAQEAEFDELQTQLNLMPIQGMLMGEVGVFGDVAATGYQAYSYADLGQQTYHAAVSGKPEDAVSVLLPLVAGKAAHLGGADEEPIGPTRDPATELETPPEHVGAPPDPATQPVPPDPVSPGASGGGAIRPPALTGDDMVDFILNQRGFTGNRPGTLNAEGAGVGTGYSTNSMVQIVGADGTQIATEISRYGGTRDLHAERQALDALRQRVGGADLEGSTLRVAVDQNTCGECTAEIRQFAADYNVARIEVYGPSRASLTSPTRTVSPKTAARMHFSGKAQAEATLLWAEDVHP